MRTGDLHGAVVVVTGASSGVGRATALAFAHQGAHLVLAARDHEGLDRTAADCQARGAIAVAVLTDVTDPDRVEALADAAVARFGAIDVWVEAAAVLIAGTLEDHPVDELRRLVDTNVTGMALGARVALRRFRVRGRGVLILVSSLLGLVPNPLAPAYVMSKFAVRGLALSLRQSVVGEARVHVCAVLPGPVDTPMFDRAANHTGRRLRSIPPAIAPERIATTIVRCARRPRRQATTGVVAHLVLMAHRLAPRLTERLVAVWSARLLLRSEPVPDTSGAVGGVQAGTGEHGGWRRGGLRRRLGSWLGGRGLRSR